ncbi:MAG: hypothetical protein E7271_10610 [Lachnospiraceae bacterium]|jgi:hypothetical protein|nr:hypothetical protein [Lachnospiraceae bacterium]
MHSNKELWKYAKDELVLVTTSLGFPAELGYEMAKQLGSPKAIKRMTAYLANEKPKKVEIVVDEMIAICEEIQTWKEKKLSEEANASYNELLRNQ